MELNKPLKNLNTFGIEAHAKAYIAVETLGQLIDVILKNPEEDKFILGGGSNILLTQDIDALVIHIQNKGIEVIFEDNDHVWVEVQAGELWHPFVLWTMGKNYGGLENLSLIPGQVGTAPMQNIGAYGVEIKDHFVYCDALHLPSLTLKRFDNEACQFGYRESFFKNEGKGHYVIWSVVFKLTKQNHELRTSYGSIAEELEQMNIHHPTIQDISKAVIQIRSSKLPDPKQLGNSGSFFKNPVVEKGVVESLLKEFPSMPHYKVSETTYKVPAGWLIENAGFKGKRFGHVGMHEKQALVLVNYGQATGNELWAFAQKVQTTVYEKFGISITPEVNVI